MTNNKDMKPNKLEQPRRFLKQLSVYEVAPREGFQSQSIIVNTETKLEVINRLVDAGLRHIEITGFFHPTVVPQLADAEQVLARLKKRHGVKYMAHVPNLKGLSRAAAVGVDSVVVCLSVSDEISRRNIDDCTSTNDCFKNLEAISIEAKNAHIWVRVFLTNSWGSPYEDSVSRRRVINLVKRILDLGVDEICLADTLAAATPGKVEHLLDILTEHIPVGRLALHFHDNRGMAIANAIAGLSFGIAKIDSSVAGFGGHGHCPYIPENPLMLATEDLVFMLDGYEVHTGVDLKKVRAVGQQMARVLNRPVPGRYAAAGPVERFK